MRGPPSKLPQGATSSQAKTSTSSPNHTLGSSGNTTTTSPTRTAANSGPLGVIDDIFSQKTKQAIAIDRGTLAHWLLHACRIEDGVYTDQYAFQVLEVKHEDDALYFWRTNQPKGKFLRCGDPEWQKTQDDRRRQQRAILAKDHQARQQGNDAWAGYRSDRGGRTGGYSRWETSGSQSYPWSKDASRQSQAAKWG